MTRRRVSLYDDDDNLKKQKVSFQVLKLVVGYMGSLMSGTFLCFIFPSISGV